ncbi:MAG: hypothetical protein Q8O76_00275 [Chloroflexota bacterium]|nr:hypothetical protein [Chloroflexota bacterium]
MKDVTSARGLSNLRTATTTRLHTKPPQKGTEHLDLYLLGKEQQRLEQELSGLERRQRRIQAHLAEIRKAMAKLEEEAHQEGPSAPQAPPGGNPPARDYRQRTWKTMSLDY